jgi:hypothetical protein
MRRAIINRFGVILFRLNTTSVNAGRSISSINVTTKVLPVVKYEIVHQEKNLFITEENLKTGYIDVRGAMIFSVLSNSSNGYVITFFVGRGLFNKIEVFYDAVSSEIHDANNEIYMPAGEMKYKVKEFGFRFYLSDILMPGMYDWPVEFMIQAV